MTSQSLQSLHGLKPNCLSFGEVLAQSFAVIAPTTIPVSNIGLIVALAGKGTWLSVLIGLVGLVSVSININLAIFFVLVGVWCYAAYQLTRLPAIAEALTRYGNQFVPYVLIGLGAMILWDSQTLADRVLIVIASLIGIGYLMRLGRMLPSQIQE
ncbi:MAG: cadmium resistance transporter [Elainella sp. C42_A2020_010]|nr:cadmium resistance transporter [Elainella sp. C42_A2020_010]